MGIIIYFTIIIASIVIVASIQSDKMKEKEKLEPTILRKQYTYIGGLDELTDKSIVEFCILKNDNVKLYFKHPRFNKAIEIPFGDIISVENKLESEVSKDITLTRLVALGVFAFAFKKKKQKIEKFLILKYFNEYKEEQVLVFNCLRPEEAVVPLKQKLRKIKAYN